MPKIDGKYRWNFRYKLTKWPQSVSTIVGWWASAQNRREVQMELQVEIDKVASISVNYCRLVGQCPK